jgi:hypothetical protein
MANQSDERWYWDREQLAAALDLHGSQNAVADATGVRRSTLATWFKRHDLRSGHKFTPGNLIDTSPTPTLPPTPPTSTEPARVAEPLELVQMQRRVDRAEAEARSLKAQLKHATKHANIVEDVRDMLAPVIDGCVIPRPTPIPRRKKTGKRKPLTAVLHLTDLHFDEIVEASTLNGVNAYSPEIAAARIQYAVDTLVEIASNYSNHGIDELVLAVNGDTFGGAIHQDSAEYSARVARQALNAALILAQVATELASVFPRVRVLGTVGNHTRSTNRMPTGKARVDSSWELLMHEQAAALLDRVSNVTYEVARGYTLDTMIGPSRWAFSHGDAVKGGGGQLGVPAYGLKRQHDANREWSMVLAQLMALTADTIVKHTRVGHFHTFMAWQAGAGDIVLAPSPKGVDPFVKDVLGKYSPPQLLVEIVHPEHDIIAHHLIDLAHITDPDASSRYVWNGSGDLGMAVDVMREWSRAR